MGGSLTRRIFCVEKKKLEKKLCDQNPRGKIPPIKKQTLFFFSKAIFLFGVFFWYLSIYLSIYRSIHPYASLMSTTPKNLHLHPLQVKPTINKNNPLERPSSAIISLLPIRSRNIQDLTSQAKTIKMKLSTPGDSSRVLFIPARWRSRFHPFQKGHVNSPSQKGHDPKTVHF